jgi:hypothetical protein
VWLGCPLRDTQIPGRGFAVREGLLKGDLEGGEDGEFSHLVVRDLMLEAVPYSSVSSLLTRAIWSRGGMISEIMLVPFLRGKRPAPQSLLLCTRLPQSDLGMGSFQDRVRHAA